MCCVNAGQSHQCMGMTLKAALNESNMNCKWISAIKAADSQKMEQFQLSDTPTLIQKCIKKDPAAEIKQWEKDEGEFYETGISNLMNKKTREKKKIWKQIFLTQTSIPKWTAAS